MRKASDSELAAVSGIPDFESLREQCPVARSESLNWAVLRHAELLRVLQQPQVFGNAVSTHLAVPNGMDGAIHAEFRRIIDPYFAAPRMAAFEPLCRDIARGIIESMPRDREIDLMDQVAPGFALQALCAFLDWPPQVHASLGSWTVRNQQAIRTGDRAAMAQVATDFDGYIRAAIKMRRDDADESADDVVSRLLRERVQGRSIADEEIVSILRNWTVGELATVAASVGILIHFLARHSSLQVQLRERRLNLDHALDEILRIHPPLLASRRRARCEIELGGRLIGADERLTLLWAPANRDPRVFGDPDEFSPDGNARDNLLYGAGIHACPGAPLARLSLRVLVEELLAQGQVAPGGSASVPATYPAAGFARVAIRIAQR